MAAAVESIAAGAGTAGEKEGSFKALFDGESAKYLSSGDSSALATLTALGQHLTGASFQISRPVLQHAAAALKAAPVSDQLVKLAETLMGQLKARQSSFLVSDYLLRETLHTAYIHANSFAQAANVLAQMDIEAAAKAVGLSDSQRFLVYVRVAQSYMKAGDDYHADEFTRKANAEGILDCGDPLVELQYLVCLGFVQDARRSFAQAANCFHRVSTMQHESLAAAELEVLLQKSSICAVLSPPGPSRTRMLDVVMRDPRSVLLPTFSMLSKMHKGQFITPADVDAFCALLKDDPAKLATDAEGLNDVQKAARLHNLAAVARVYRNISFASLGALLGVGEEEAEDLAARMIQEDRLAGVIDQASGTLEFAKSADPLHTWDRRLTASTAQLASVSERIAAKHPSIAEAALAEAGASDPTASGPGQAAGR